MHRRISCMIRGYNIVFMQFEHDKIHTLKEDGQTKRKQSLHNSKGICRNLNCLVYPVITVFNIVADGSLSYLDKIPHI